MTRTVFNLAMISFFFSIIYILIHQYSCKEKFLQKCTGLMILLFFPFSFLGLYLKMPYTMIFLLLGSVVVSMKVYKRRFFQSLTISFAVIFVFTLGEFFQAIFMYLLNIDLNFVRTDLKYYIPGTMQSFVFSICIIYVARKIKALWEKRRGLQIHNVNKALTVYYIVVTLVTSVLLSLLFTSKYTSTKEGIILFMCGILFVLLAFLTGQFIKSKTRFDQLQLKSLQNEYENLKNYTELIESLSNDIKLQKHEYRNTLFAIKGYLDDSRYEQLEEYFYSHVLGNHEETGPEGFDYHKLYNIKQSGLKGLIHAKLMHAGSKQLSVDVSASSPINIDSMNEIDLYTIIGNLIDNAIEASNESSDKLLIIVFTSIGGNTEVTISNSYESEPDIRKIFQKGYSSKGTNRGVGLTIVKNRLQKYAHVQLETSIEDNMFHQSLLFTNP